MKGWLLDQNLPTRLTFAPELPVSYATAIAPNPTDSQLWDHAREHRLVIVTKDADFSDRIILHTPPPWVVHLRFGNLRRREFHGALSRVWPQVEALLKSHKLVNVYLDRVEGSVNATGHWPSQRAKTSREIKPQHISNPMIHTADASVWRQGLYGGDPRCERLRHEVGQSPRCARWQCPHSRVNPRGELLATLSASQTVLSQRPRLGVLRGCHRQPLTPAGSYLYSLLGYALRSVQRQCVPNG